MILRRWLIGVMYIGCLGMMTCCQNKQNTAEQTRPDKFPVMKFLGSVHDFGSITEGDTISHVFKFKNIGNMPLLISHASTPCGCTVPEWPKDPIAPGAGGEIKVTFNSKNKVGFVIKGDGTMTDQSYTQNLSFNAFSQILGTAENNRNKKANLSQAEQIMLYNMLRTTQDKVLGHYRDYKISRKKLFKAKIDSAPQNEIKQQEKQLVIYRQHLIDLAGQEAVDNLDQKLDAEFKGSAQH